MSNEVDPVAGRWYEYVERDQKFEVVDVDDERGVIEVQYTNGEIDEMDIDEWYDLEIEPIEVPEEGIGRSVVPPEDRPRAKHPKRPGDENEAEDEEEDEREDWADDLDENERSRDED